MLGADGGGQHPGQDIVPVKLDVERVQEGDCAFAKPAERLVTGADHEQDDGPEALLLPWAEAQMKISIQYQYQEEYSPNLTFEVLFRWKTMW